MPWPLFLRADNSAVIATPWLHFAQQRCGYSAAAFFVQRSANSALAAAPWLIMAMRLCGCSCVAVCAKQRCGCCAVANLEQTSALVPESKEKKLTMNSAVAVVLWQHFTKHRCGCSAVAFFSRSANSVLAAVPWPIMAIWRCGCSGVAICAALCRAVAHTEQAFVLCSKFIN